MEDPRPKSFSPAWPPHIHRGRYVEHYGRAFLLAGLFILMAGVVLFGPWAAWVASCCVAGAVLGGVLLETLARRRLCRARQAYWLQVLTLGVLLALTLPPTVGWQVGVIGGATAVLIGYGLLGGLGNTLWHPALVGRATVALLFAAQVAPATIPFLARGRLLTGDLASTADAGVVYYGYERSTLPESVSAWTMPRPIEVLAQRCYGTDAPAADAPSLLRLFRDYLPPWQDTVFGHVGGGIGETCVVALALAALLLINRGYVRWHLPAGALAAVTILAAVWPVQVLSAAGDVSGGLALRWFPVTLTQDGFHVGAAIVLFHLTGGGLWLAACLIATDPVTSPLTSRGQFLFGIGLGVLVMVARCNSWSPALPGAAYWAVLGMNTLVPFIDRVSARRPYGTSRVVRESAAKRI